MNSSDHPREGLSHQHRSSAPSSQVAVPFVAGEASRSIHHKFEGSVQYMNATTGQLMRNNAEQSHDLDESGTQANGRRVSQQLSEVPVSASGNSIEQAKIRN